ncbi:MAG TPA: molybdopterin-dependent oxidoreductase [Ktedonobacterales bacterium]|jgi:DMSO/TMAO reductase YedYZ molybdopterin-dependent catalytic subunit|nr:molybdopterin-dependent oxidoreductase [Ktedonobacterales bacterium]
MSQLGHKDDTASRVSGVGNRAQAALAEVRRLGPAGSAQVAMGWLGLGARLGVIPLIAGLLGSLAAVITMGALRLTWGAPTLPELFGERLLLSINVNQFIALLLRFAPNSKTTPLLLALLGQFVVGILLGPAYALATRLSLRVRGPWPTRREWLVAGIFALALEALTQLLFWPVLMGNLLGDPVGRARVINGVGTLLVFIVFMGVIALGNRWLRVAWGEGLAPRAEEVSQRSLAGWTVSRRAALGAAGAVVVGVGASALATRGLIDGYVARSNLAYEGMETPYAVSQATQLTPNANFYVVSKNVLDPTVQVDRWQLEVNGLVRQSRVWSLDQVMALPSETRAVTFECIANGPGGHLMSTAMWTGVSLERVIAEAGGADPASKYAVFTSVDGFQSSLPLADLLEARTMLAYRMNGVRLPDRHGYPLRVVVPGRYGEQSPKWLTRIELATERFKGLYQSQGWRDGQLYTTSRIEFPASKAHVKLAPIMVTGLAFAGIRGVRRVEVSSDNGATWSPATLKPPLSDQSWVYWSWQWTPPAPGTYTLVVRATDGTGAIQSPVQTSTVPNGATGQHHVPVVVVG